MTIGLAHFAVALLAHGALAFLVCACVLIAPHNCRRTGVYGSIAFSLLAGACIGAISALTVAEHERQAETVAPASWQVSIELESRK